MDRKTLHKLVNLADKIVNGKSKRYYNKIKELFSNFLKDYCRPVINIKDFIVYDLPRGIKNLFIWAPIIWRDRNWDFIYLFFMLHKKLSLMEPVIRDGHCVGGEDQAKDIKTCKLLVKRIIDDNYYENAFINHERKWGELNITWLPTENSNYCRLEVERTNVKTEKEKEIERKQSKFLYEHADKMKDQDVKLLFKMMSKKGLTWWD